MTTRHKIDAPDEASGGVLSRLAETRTERTGAGERHSKHTGNAYCIILVYILVLLYPTSTLESTQTIEQPVTGAGNKRRRDEMWRRRGGREKRKFLSCRYGMPKFCLVVEEGSSEMDVCISFFRR
jgi:hypothetical protein